MKSHEHIGNRTSSTLDAAPAVYYCANALNQYEHTATDASCNNPVLWFDYDDDGNMLSDTDPATGYTYEYTWDGENRLVAQTNEPGPLSCPSKASAEQDCDRRVFRPSPSGLG